MGATLFFWLLGGQGNKLSAHDAAAHDNYKRRNAICDDLRE